MSALSQSNSMTKKVCMVTAFRIGSRQINIFGDMNLKRKILFSEAKIIVRGHCATNMVCLRGQ